MVESMENSIEDYLIDSVSYNLKPGASYINERRSSTFHPSGSNAYSTSGTKLIKIVCTGDNFMDPSTFRVMFDVVNTNSTLAKELRVLGGPGSFFRRVRLLCRGVAIEDIDDYNRVEAMFSYLNNVNSVVNSDGEAFSKWGIRTNSVNAYTANSFSGIKGGKSQTVLFKQCIGLLKQMKFIPLRYAPLT